MAAGSDRGAVTVEAAIALSSLVVVLGLILGGVAVVADQLQCTDAAREAARLVTRGQRELAEDAVRNIAPHGSRLAVRREGDTVMVEVLAEPLGGLLPGVQVGAEAYGVLEPGERAGDAGG
jgi:Flp pilus assembly protein TadG